VVLHRLLPLSVLHMVRHHQCSYKVSRWVTWLAAVDTAGDDHLTERSVCGSSLKAPCQKGQFNAGSWVGESTDQA
jgi:hypothetical protein